ncbi:MAG TPA: type II toxin-antitoxin system HicB family antitoxin [Polyangiaceae bacterium]|jgi:predicted RNase H-like HicB family nuclease
MRYLIVVEKTESGFSAYPPDLPGCVATAGTREAIARKMSAAIAFHLKGLKAEGLQIPEPSTFSSYVDV